MKVLFTADLHIKLGQKNVPVPWALDRYSSLFAQLKKYQKEADLLVLGGDIFDRVPTMEELEVYFELINSINIPCFIYSGNHEAKKKNTTFLTNLAKATKSANPNVTILDDYFSVESYETIDFIPYNKLKEFAESGYDFKGTILCTHVRGEIPPHVKPEVPLQLFDRWDIVLAGDLHSYGNSQRNILYPGSPVTTSFHRNLVDTGVILLDSKTLTHEWLKLELPQLIRKTIAVGEPMPATEYHHTIYEVEGDMSELGDVIDNDLIDKKLIRRVMDTALILEPSMTLVDELREYLLYILQLPENTVESLVQILNDNLAEITKNDTI